MQEKFVGLCEGRHEIPEVTEYLFPTQVSNPLDFSSHYTVSYAKIQEFPEDVHLHLYVTGLTPVLTVFLSAWTQDNDDRRRAGSSTRPITIYHFNRNTMQYEPHWF